MRTVLVVIAVTFLTCPAAAAQEPGSTDAVEAPPAAPPPRPAVLVPLYISLASLQVLDIASTVHAIDEHGASEGNPIMRSILGSPPAAAATKVAITAMSIYTADRLWKKHRTAAILLMVGLNGGYAAIVIHNYRIR